MNCWFVVVNASQVVGSGIVLILLGSLWQLAIFIGAVASSSSLLWLKSHKFGNTVEPREVLADLQLQLLPAAAKAES